MKNKKKSGILVSIVCLFLFSLFGGTIEAIAEKFTVRAHVQDQAGEVVPDADVKLKPYWGTEEETTTNSQGNLEFLVENPTAVQEEKKQENILNINRDGINYNLIKDAKVRLYNSNGQTVQSFDVSGSGFLQTPKDLASGLYFYEFLSPDFKGTAKVTLLQGDIVGGKVFASNYDVMIPAFKRASELSTLELNKDGYAPKSVIFIIGQEYTTFNDKIVMERLYRMIKGNITEHFEPGVPVSGVLIRTSLEDVYTDDNGNFSVKASTGREDMVVNGPNHLESGIIFYPSANDTTIAYKLGKTAHSDTWERIRDELYQKAQNHEDLNEYNDERQQVLNELDEQKGIDPEYFKDYILTTTKKINPGVYKSLTEESVPDTFYIGGDVIRARDGAVVSEAFKNVEQLNEIAKTINVEGYALTNGLFGEERTVIAIADSKFADPDSTAKFDYSNMVVVSEDEFPAELEKMKKSAIVVGRKDFLGGNVTRYSEENENIITGISIILMNDLTPVLTRRIMLEEFYSGLDGGVESEIGYPALIDTTWGTLTNHDERMSKFIAYRGPGRVFPDHPAGFMNK